MHRKLGRNACAVRLSRDWGRGTFGTWGRGNSRMRRRGTRKLWDSGTVRARGRDKQTTSDFWFEFVKVQSSMLSRKVLYVVEFISRIVNWFPFGRQGKAEGRKGLWGLVSPSQLTWMLTWMLTWILIWILTWMLTWKLTWVLKGSVHWPGTRRNLWKVLRHFKCTLSC